MHAIVEADRERLLEEVGTELALGVPFPGLRCRVLARACPVCVVRAGHPVIPRARREGALSLERYLALRHVQVHPLGMREASSIDEALAAQGLRREVVASVTHLVSALFIAASSDLVVTLPRGVAEPLASTFSLETLEPPLSLPDDVLVMTWHERFEEDPANEWLRSAVVRVNDRVHMDEGKGATKGGCGRRVRGEE